VPQIGRTLHLFTSSPLNPLCFEHQTTEDINNDGSEMRSQDLGSSSSSNFCETTQYLKNQNPCPNTPFSTHREIFEYLPLSSQGWLDLKEDFEQWEEWKSNRDSEMSSFAVIDSRTEEDLEAEREVNKKLKNAYKTLKMAKKKEAQLKKAQRKADNEKKERREGVEEVKGGGGEEKQVPQLFVENPPSTIPEEEEEEEEEESMAFSESDNEEEELDDFEIERQMLVRVYKETLSCLCKDGVCPIGLSLDATRESLVDLLNIGFTISQVREALGLGALYFGGSNISEDAFISGYYRLKDATENATASSSSHTTKKMNSLLKKDKKLRKVHKKKYGGGGGGGSGIDLLKKQPSSFKSSSPIMMDEIEQVIPPRRKVSQFWQNEEEFVKEIDLESIMGQRKTSILDKMGGGGNQASNIIQTIDFSSLIEQREPNLTNSTTSETKKKSVSISDQNQIKKDKESCFSSSLRQISDEEEIIRLSRMNSSDLEKVVLAVGTGRNAVRAKALLDSTPHAVAQQMTKTKTKSNQKEEEDGNLMDIAPSFIDFGRVVPFQESVISLTITNLSPSSSLKFRVSRKIKGEDGGWEVRVRGSAGRGIAPGMR